MALVEIPPSWTVNTKEWWILRKNATEQKSPVLPMFENIGLPLDCCVLGYCWCCLMNTCTGQGGDNFLHWSLILPVLRYSEFLVLIRALLHLTSWEPEDIRQDSKASRRNRSHSYHLRHYFVPNTVPTMHLAENKKSTSDILAFAERNRHDPWCSSVIISSPKSDPAVPARYVSVGRRLVLRYSVIVWSMA